MFTKLNKYSDARCNDIISMRIKENLRMNLRRVISRFWKCFILRKGYREGRYGFLIALIALFFSFLSKTGALKLTFNIFLKFACYHFS